MKRIAIFCDGTWNWSGAKYQTNVVRLAEAVPTEAPDGVKQQVIYQKGVGTGRGSNKFAKALDKFGGGAFGWGLTDNIEDIYRALVLSYEVGDDIYVFGFSRGAYTARSLVGLIRACGIVPRTDLAAIPRAIAYYRSRDQSTRPRVEESIIARAKMSPDVSTSMADVEYRKANGFPDPFLLRIAFLGVWDTVGAQGLPGVFGAVARRWNKQYEFHDADLSSMVRTARHAIATDERRKLYPAATWDNLEELNGDTTGFERPYRQDWFPGDHSSVGGGGDERGIANITLRWMAQGASDVGLAFWPEMLAKFEKAENPHARLTAHSKAGMITAAMKLISGDRAGPKGEPVKFEDISEATRLRAAADPTYRPGPLKHCL